AIIHTSTNELVAGCKNSHIPNSVTSLGDYCFAGCSSLTSITIPNSVMSLSYCCFYDCSSLTAITIPNSVTSLGNACFYRCSSLTAITIPNSVTSLGSACFYGCSSLASITLGNSVMSLGQFCFYGCSSLASITLGNSVTSIGKACFSYCSNLERMVVDAANPVFDSREDCNAIIHTSTNELIAGCKNSQIPNSVTSLGDYCFAGCSSLTSITIPNSVMSLSYCCFSGCSSLASITIPNSVTSLGGRCFSGCSCLTSIHMLRSTPPSTESNIFGNTPLETVYVVDEDAKTAYKAQAPWNEYEIVAMPTGIEEMETDKTAPTIVGYYDLNGRQVSSKQRGPIIIRYSDGTSRRVIMK
ncbi:MAG: leucine-rich repeat domain-containing protein, partial [Bacteroidales bacterium]|nr:leucine-rich repeat domain-containing protein [Bacteroidales bacterium]